jgi:hypothetical protein
MTRPGHYETTYIELLRSIHSAGGVICEKYPQFFYPEDMPNPDQRALATKIAKKLCSSCPIIEQCFEYALETNQQHGIWGGTSPNER